MNFEHHLNSQTQNQIWLMKSILLKQYLAFMKMNEYLKRKLVLFDLKELKL